MVGEFLLDIVFGLVKGFFNLLPDFSWSVETTAFTYFISIIEVAAYMLPIQTIATIIGLIFRITIFQIVISFIKTIWDLLPLT